MDDWKAEGGDRKGLEDQAPMSATNLFKSLGSEQEEEQPSFADSSVLPFFNAETPSPGVARPEQPLHSSGPGDSSIHQTPAFANPEPANAASSGFTQFFRSADFNATPAPTPTQRHPEELRDEDRREVPTVAPASGIASPLPPPPAPAPAAEEPGEFTRIFVQLPSPKTGEPLSAAPNAAAPEPPAQLPAEPAARSAVKEAVPTPRGEPPPLKNFSPPGQSSSAYGDGNFTQLFRATPPAAQPPQAVPIQATPAPARAKGPEPLPPLAPDPATAAFASPATHAPARPPLPPTPRPSSSFEDAGVTRLFSDQGPQQSAGTGAMWPEQPFSPPSATRPPQGASHEPGVTKLMQALSDGEQPGVWTPSSSSDSPNLPSSMPAFGPAPVRPTQPVFAQDAAPAAASGPGEFTRIVSGLGAPPPLPADPVVQAPAAPPPAKAAAAPSASPPAEAASAAKPGTLQQFLPILLILNAFLLIVLILVVVFALRRH